MTISEIESPSASNECPEGKTNKVFDMNFNTVESFNQEKTKEELGIYDERIKEALAKKNELLEKLEQLKRENSDPETIEKIKEYISLEDNIINDEGEFRRLLINHLKKFNIAA